MSKHSPNQDTKDEELITISELCKRLKISRSHAYTLMNKKDGMPSVRVGSALRFQYKQVLEYFEEMSTKKSKKTS